MAKHTAAKREALREKLISIAEQQIQAEGLAALRARSLANEAGCAVGAIYNVFDDLTGLVLAVNGRTFKRMGQGVAKIMAEAEESTPSDQLILIAKAYLRFAADNPNLWRALFDVEMSLEGGAPAWYMDELGKLFSIIATPLSEIYPEAPASEIDLKTRALFSSVHGMVLLGLEKRISGVPAHQIEDMIEYLLRNVTRS